MKNHTISTSYQGIDKFSKSSFIPETLNVIVDPLKSQTFQRLQNLTSTLRIGMKPTLIEYDNLQDFSLYDLQIDCGLYVIKNQSAIYSLYKINPNYKELKYDIVLLKDLKPYYRYLFCVNNTNLISLAILSFYEVTYGT